MFSFFKNRRRKRLRLAGIPCSWRAIVAHNVPMAATLTPSERDELFRILAVFLAEKEFEGAGGLEVTEEIRVTIAAQACMLLIGRNDDYFSETKRIVVYPEPYVGRGQRQVGAGMVVETAEPRLGESWGSGTVVLAWSRARHDARTPSDGHNLVLHEFAHQLDEENGEADGAPALESGRMFAPWAAAMLPAYEALVASSRTGVPSVLDAYGATNPAEFFAVATETFFERPQLLRDRLPALYAQLQGFYRQDPAARHAPPPPVHQPRRRHPRRRVADRPHVVPPSSPPEI
jgi:hypothetical protein